MTISNQHNTKSMTGTGLALLILLSSGVAIGQGYDNYSTPDIDEGAIGSGYDNYSTPGIDEGAINLKTNDSNDDYGYKPYEYKPYGTDSNDNSNDSGYKPYEYKPYGTD